jgi:hypothetical protein
MVMVPPKPTSFPVAKKARLSAVSMTIARPLTELLNLPSSAPVAGLTTCPWPE